jgi:4-amino-4-deoxy-L-arabinose transferase-like glycosyltransferase
MRRRPVLVATLLLALALGLRLAQVERTGYRPLNDARSYLRLAAQISQTGDYSSHGLGAGGTIGPSAYFPPAYPYLLAASDLIAGRTSAPLRSVGAARIEQAFVGSAIVALIGLVAFELFGTGTALIALALAAVYPVLIELSAVIVAENMLTVALLLAVYATLRAGRADAPLRWTLACRGFVGLAALTHENGVLLVIPVAFGVRAARTVLARKVVWAPVVLVAAALLAVSPWVVRDAVELHTFVPISDESGITLAGTYNPTSAATRDPPWKWRYYGLIPSDRAIAHIAASLTESQLDTRLETRALHYIAKHPLAPLKVFADNTLRLLELEGSKAWRASAASIGIPLGFAHFGVLSFWLLALLALAGVGTRAARAAPRWLWGVPLVVWLSVALVNAETPRFREPIDAFLILLAACALASAARRLRSPDPRGSST